MFALSRFPSSAAVYLTASVSVLTAQHLSAQNFTARSSVLSPFGVNGPLPFGVFSEFGGSSVVKGGLSYGVGLSSTYISNVLLSEDDPESDVFLGVSPTLSYTSDPEGGARVALAANYAPAASASLNNSEFSSFDQSGNVSLIISGSRTTISAFAGISQVSGADSLAVSKGFFTGTAVSLGLQAGYQLAPRTSVSAGVSSAITAYGDGSGSGNSGGGSAVGFNGYSFNLAASWAASARFGFGPSLNYSVSNSDNISVINSWGLSAVGSYKVSEKINVAASIGGQYSDNSEAGAPLGLSPTGSLNANYQIDELWSWSSTIQSGLTPSPTKRNYVINGWSISSNLNRQLLIGSVGLGLNMDFSNFERAKLIGNYTSHPASQQNIGLSLSYSRPLFRDRVGFTSSLRYTINYGDFEYSQLQLNAGLSMAF